MKKELSERQREIIEVSGKILLNKGIKGLTTKTLALEMGFTESAIYRHFKTKEDIIVHLLNILYKDIETRLSEISNQQKKPSEKLKLVFKSQYQFFNQHAHFTIAILSEGLFDESARIHASVMKIIGLKSDLLNRIIEEGRRTKEFTSAIDQEDMLHILMGTFRLQLLKWKFSKFTLDLEKEGNKKIASIIKLISLT